MEIVHVLREQRLVVKLRYEDVLVPGIQWHSDFSTATTRVACHSLLSMSPVQSKDALRSFFIVI